MPQLETVFTPCLRCKAEFTAQRTHYCRELLRYQRENFAQRTEINALEAHLKHSLEKLFNAERRYDNIKHQIQPHTHIMELVEAFASKFADWSEMEKNDVDELSEREKSLDKVGEARWALENALKQWRPSCTPL